MKANTLRAVMLHARDYIDEETSIGRMANLNDRLRADAADVMQAYCEASGREPKDTTFTRRGGRVSHSPREYGLTQAWGDRRERQFIGVNRRYRGHEQLYYQLRDYFEPPEPLEVPVPLCGL